MENHVRLTLGEKSTSKLLFDVGLNNLSPAAGRRSSHCGTITTRSGSQSSGAGKKAGVFSKDVDEKIAVFSIASIIARSRIWYSPKGKYSVDEIIEMFS